MGNREELRKYVFQSFLPPRNSNILTEKSLFCNKYYVFTAINIGFTNSIWRNNTIFIIHILLDIGNSKVD